MLEFGQVLFEVLLFETGNFLQFFDSWDFNIGVSLTVINNFKNGIHFHDFGDLLSSIGSSFDLKVSSLEIFGFDINQDISNELIKSNHVVGMELVGHIFRGLVIEIK